MLVLKREKLTFSGLTWIPEQFANSGFRSGMWVKALGASEGGEGMGEGGQSGLPSLCRTPLVPAHLLKESSVAITVGLLGP